MTKREALKQEIDKLPDEVLDDLMHFVRVAKRGKKNSRRKLRTFSLKGQFDCINIREKAYE